MLNMDRRIDRFDKYMEYKELNDNKVTNALSLSVGTLGKSRKTGRDLSDKVIEKILNFYTDLNKIWLLTGVGGMLKWGHGDENAKTVKPTEQTTLTGTVDVAELIASFKQVANAAEESAQTARILAESIGKLLNQPAKVGNVAAVSAPGPVMRAVH